jgi:hypothetical protein
VTHESAKYITRTCVHAIHTQVNSNPEDDVHAFLDSLPWGMHERNDISTVHGKFEAYVVRYVCIVWFLERASQFLGMDGLRQSCVHLDASVLPFIALSGRKLGHLCPVGQC